MHVVTAREVFNSQCTLYSVHRAFGLLFDLWLLTDVVYCIPDPHSSFKSKLFFFSKLNFNGFFKTKLSIIKINFISQFKLYAL